MHLLYSEVIIQNELIICLKKQAQGGKCQISLKKIKILSYMLFYFLSIILRFLSYVF